MCIALQTWHQIAKQYRHEIKCDRKLEEISTTTDSGGEILTLQLMSHNVTNLVNETIITRQNGQLALRM